MSVAEVHKAIEQNKIAVDSGSEASVADGFNPFRGIQKRKFLSLRTLSVICVWYLFSFIALFLSKHILDIYQVDLLFFSKYDFNRAGRPFLFLKKMYLF